MRIGFDFDNTIAGYDHVFLRVARERGLVADGFVGTKRELRDVVRAGRDGETEWMRLQGQVYGPEMEDAELIDGVGDFLARCRGPGLDLVIVSHKTKFGHFDGARVNLRDASRAWMENQGLFDDDAYGLRADRVYFEPTRDRKIARIADLGCTHFIDDLAEVFLEPAFPTAVERYLFAAGNGALPSGPFKAFRHWHEISDDLLGVQG